MRYCRPHIQRLLLYILLIGAASCTYSPSQEQSAANFTDRVEIELNAALTRIAAVSPQSDRIELSFQASDQLHIAVIQDNLVTFGSSSAPLRIREALPVKLEHPIDASRPYRVVGYVGNASWEKESGKAVIRLNPPRLSHSLEEAINSGCFTFSSEVASGKRFTAQLHSLGSVFEVRIFGKTEGKLSKINFYAANRKKWTIGRGVSRFAAADNQFISEAAESNEVDFHPDVDLKPEAAQSIYLWLPIIHTENLELGMDFTVNGHSQRMDGSISLETADRNKVYLMHTEISEYSITPNYLKDRKEWTFSRENWMSNYSANTPLNYLLIPGTHDSGTSVMGGLLKKTQEDSIYHQLQKGIRYLDIRLHNDTRRHRLEIYHGSFGSGLEFREDVMKVVTGWLKNHPTETIVMLVKEENGSPGSNVAWIEEMKKVLEDYRTVFLKNLSPSTTLGEARGKIVLVSRGNMLNIGCMTVGWPGSDSGTVELCDEKEEKAFDIFVQDKYSGGGNWDKANLVKQICEQSVGNYRKRVWTWNYVSFTYRLRSIWSIAQDINPQIRNYLNQTTKERKRFHGIMIMDFATAGSGPSTVSAILNNGLQETENTF